MFNFCIWGPLHSLIPNPLLVLTLFLLCYAINILAEDWFQTIPHVSIFLPSRIWKYYTIHLEELCDIDFLSNRWEVFRYKIYQNNISKKFIPISNTLNHLFSEEKSILSIWQIKDFLNVSPVAKNKSFLDLLQNISFLYFPTFSPLRSLDFINSVK